MVGWTVRILVLLSKLSYGIIEFYRLTQKMVVMLMQEDGINFYYHVRICTSGLCVWLRQFVYIFVCKRRVDLPLLHLLSFSLTVYFSCAGYTCIHGPHLHRCDWCTRFHVRSSLPVFHSHHYATQYGQLLSLCLYSFKVYNTYCVF